MARILLVEDNDMNRDMLSRRLQRKGHEVLMAAVMTHLVAGQDGVWRVIVKGCNICPGRSLGHDRLPKGRKFMQFFEPKHYLVPFLAHALGTLAGAFTAATIAASRRMGIALGLGVVFLAGGISASVMLPAPLWFEALDLIAAYLPMAWLGAKLAMRKG